MDHSPPSVTDLLNAQTGKLGWPELARHFARGALVWVHPDEDLVEIAAGLVGDAAGKVAQLAAEGRLKRADDEDAIRWQAEGPVFWAVVVAPWVLVQETGETAAAGD
jgi:hypothetical protein